VIESTNVFSLFDECEHSCETETTCNAFTYNQINGVCFLKSAAAQWTTITLGAITGIKLSPLLPSELSPPSEGKRGKWIAGPQFLCHWHNAG
jgi:PAN domain-containing protein